MGFRTSYDRLYSWCFYCGGAIFSTAKVDRLAWIYDCTDSTDALVWNDSWVAMDCYCEPVADISGMG